VLRVEHTDDSPAVHHGYGELRQAPRVVVDVAGVEAGVVEANELPGEGDGPDDAGAHPQADGVGELSRPRILRTEGGALHQVLVLGIEEVEDEVFEAHAGDGALGHVPEYVVDLGLLDQRVEGRGARRQLGRFARHGDRV